ncbi:MAG TPA: recombination-associated protein RdgC [Candidatus Mailhella merdavium]|nr:recombination-associated protein RdgC [Candidatus Mailhella merdavium]
MSGFMSSSTALTICKADSAAGLALDALRQHAFTPDIDADGRRLGWVALGDPLDTDGFELAAVDSRYSGFSFRLDTRKASGAVIRLQLAEAVREERFSGKKVGSKRKKELKEAITAKLTAGRNLCRPSLTASGMRRRDACLSARRQPRRYSRCLTCSRPRSALMPRPSRLRTTCRSSLPLSCAGKATPVKATHCIRWVPPVWPLPNRRRKRPPWLCRTA